MTPRIGSLAKDRLAGLRLPIPETCAPSRCSVALNVNVHGASATHPAAIHVGTTAAGKTVRASISLSDDKPHWITLPALKNDGKERIAFRVPHATSPKALGENQDPRILGVSLQSITLLHEHGRKPY